MDLSIVILNYNAGYFLDLCLLSVEKAIKKVNAEVIVVDNNSSDDSYERNRCKQTSFQFIQNKENLGFAKGNNVAIDSCKGEFVLFLNPDTLLKEDCLSTLLTYARNNTEVGAIGVRMLDGSGGFLPESKRMLPTPGVALRKMMGTHKIFPKSKFWAAYYAGSVPQNAIEPVNVISGAFLWVSQSVGNRIGWWDDRYFMYAEDIDFSWSVEKAGYQVMYFGESEIIHFKGESTSPSNTKANDSFFYSMRQFYDKNFTDTLSRILKPIIYLGISLGKRMSKRTLPIVQDKKTMMGNYCFVGSPKNLSLAQSITGLEASSQSENIESIQNKTFDSIIFDTNIPHQKIIEQMQHRQGSYSVEKFYFLLPKEKVIIGSGSKKHSGVQLKTD